MNLKRMFEFSGWETTMIKAFFFMTMINKSFLTRIYLVVACCQIAVFHWNITLLYFWHFSLSEACPKLSSRCEQVSYSSLLCFTLFNAPPLHCPLLWLISGINIEIWTGLDILWWEFNTMWMLLKAVWPEINRVL